MNRNRVLRSDEGWDWITLAVRSNSPDTPVMDVVLHDAGRSRRLILGRLMHYRQSAPFAKITLDLVSDVLDVPAGCSLVDVDVRGLEAVCGYLGIRLDLRRSSQISFKLSGPSHPGAWAPAVSAAVGGDEYLNPPGGAGLFVVSEFKELGITPLLCHTTSFKYLSGPYTFQEDLSILDALMWCSPNQIVDYLHSAVVSPLADVEEVKVA